MLPGKQYMPEDVLRILRKRFWVIVVPWAVIAAGTAGAARKLPDVYKSAALIQVVPPQVPENVVRSLTTITFQERLDAARQAILSRTKLESIIQDLKLYQEEQKTQIMDQVVQKMRSDIQVLPQKGEAFTVSYLGRSPYTVMKVTEKLAGSFIDEGKREGQVRAEGTNSFVENQVTEARRKLVETEGKLTQYRLRHAGELPTQLGANMQAIQTINQNLNAIAQALNADQTNKSMLERQIQMLEDQTEPAAAPPLPPGTDVINSTATAAQKLVQAKALLADALEVRRLGPDNPDVKYLNTLVAKFTKEAEAEALRAPVALGAAVSPAEQSRLTRLAQYRDDLDKVNKRIETNQSEEKRLRTLAASYQARVDNVPVRDAELVDLTREYETLNKIYQTLVTQREASNASVSLEIRQMGEQFKLLDPARLPQQPFSPDRLLINLMGILGGLAVGLGLVALIEYRDSTFKADHEVAQVLELPVLAVVPVMRTDAERRAEFRKRLILNLGLGSTVAVCLAVLAYTFVR